MPCGRLFLQFTGGWTNFDLKQTRRFNAPAGLSSGSGFNSYRSETDVDVFTLDVTLSNRFELTETIALTPRVGLEYAHTDVGGYTEHGLGSPLWALSVEGEAQDSFRSLLGATLTAAVTPCLNLEFRADYYHEFGDPEATLVSSFQAAPSLRLTTEGQDMGRETGRLGAGLNWQIGERAKLGLDYDFTISKDYTGHDVGAILRVEF